MKKKCRSNGTLQKEDRKSKGEKENRYLISDTKCNTNMHFERALYKMSKRKPFG